MDKARIKALKERALQTGEPPAYESKEDVPVLGEALAEPVIWKGHQWAVTAWGIEARDGKYPIEGKRVWEDNHGHGWIDHMAEKSWVDLDDFAEALRIARGRWPKTVA